MSAPKPWERARKHLDGLSEDASFRPPEEIMAEFAIAYAAPLVAEMRSIVNKYGRVTIRIHELLTAYEADAKEKEG